MEPQTALVGADGGVELHPVTGVDLHLSLVVHPGHPEHNGPLGGRQPLQQGVPAVGFLIFLDNGAQGFQHLVDSLIELRLVRVLLPDPSQCFVDITHVQMSSIQRF